MVKPLTLKGKWRAVHGFTKEKNRLYREIPTSIKFFFYDIFSSRSAREKLFDETARVVEIPQWNVWPVIEGGNGENLEITRAKLLSRDDEKLLFLRFNYARYKLSPLIAAQKKRFTINRARQMIFWHQRAFRAKSDIVEANLGLVLNFAKIWQKKSHICDSDYFSELIAEGNHAIVKAVDHFDVARGFKFSTYACRAIIQGLKRFIGKTIDYRRRFPCEFSFEMEKIIGTDDWLKEMQGKDTAEALRHVLAENTAWLTKVEKKIVVERNGLHNKSGRVRTLDEIGADVELSKERVRQKQRIALEKLFKALTKKKWQKARD